MPIEPRPEILNAPIAHHGAFDYDELEQLGLSSDEVIDFSVNSNPYGPPPGVREAIANVPLDRYPDRECIALRRKLAEKHGVRIENIVVGNGTAELLLLIAMAFIQQEDLAYIMTPSFSEYPRVTKLAGGIVKQYSTSEQFGYGFESKDYVQLGNRLVADDPKVLFCCTPNNPTGRSISPDWLSKFAQRLPEMLIIVDTAYVSFTHHKEREETLLINSAKTLTNFLVVQSLTKHFAIAGLRLGYLIGHDNLISAVASYRPAWNVNSFAQVAGMVVLDEDDYVARTMQLIKEAKKELVTELKALTLTVLPSNLNFFLVKVGNATEFRSKLLAHKIMVRDCTSFGLPEYVRIATRTPEENAKLIEAVKAVLADKST